MPNSITVALVRDPKNARALSLLGVLAAQANHFEDAKDLLARALLIEGNNHEFHYNLGRVNQATGNLEGATECYRKALEINPNFGEAREALAIAEDPELVRVCIDIKPKPTLDHRYAQLAIIKRGALYTERRDASIAFYMSCRDGTDDIADNPLLHWMNKYHKQEWHGARTQEERIRLCARYRDLL